MVESEKRGRRPRIRLIALAVALFAALVGLAACGGDDDESDGLTTIEVAAIPPGSLLPTWPLLIADHEGFFEANGVKVNFIFTFDGGQLLAGGQVDILSDAADSGLIAAAQGKDIIMIAPYLLAVTDGLLVSNDVATAADLSGKTVRSSGFGTDEFVARKFVESEGLSSDEIEWVGIEDEAAALAQLEAGEIDGGMVGLGPILDAEQTGDFNTLGKLGDLGVYPWNIIQTTQTYADENPEALRGFLAGLTEGVNFLLDEANQDLAVDVAVATGVGLEEDFIRSAHDVVVAEDLYATGELTVEDIEPGLEFLEFAGEDTEGLDLEALVNNEFQPQE